MGILWTLVIGLLAGIVAKLLMPGKDPGGFIITILLGIAGAFWPPIWARPSVGTRLARVRASSAPWSAR